MSVETRKIVEIVKQLGKMQMKLLMQFSAHVSLPPCPLYRILMVLRLLKAIVGKCVL